MKSKYPKFISGGLKTEVSDKWIFNKEKSSLILVLTLGLLLPFTSYSEDSVQSKKSIDRSDLVTCTSSEEISPIKKETRKELESLQTEFEIIKFCEKEIQAESMKYNQGRLRTCLCASSEGVKNGFRQAYTSAKLLIAHPRDSAYAFYKTLGELDKVGQDVWSALLKQEWIIPPGQTAKLTEAERTAVHCEVMGEFLLGGGISKSVTEVLIKQKFLTKFTALQKEKLKFVISEGKPYASLADSALEKVNKNVGTKLEYDVVKGDGEFANYRTISILDENDKVLGHGSFEYEPKSDQLNVGSLVTEPEYQRKGVNDAVLAKTLSEYPKTKEVNITILSETNNEILQKKLAEGLSLEAAIKETAAYKSFQKLGFTEIVNPHKPIKNKNLYGVILRKGSK